MALKTSMNWLVLGAMATACNGVFYQPLQRDLYDPKRLDFDYSNEQIASSDGVKLAAWWFHSHAPTLKRKLIVHFHGNAENMTSHFLFTAWLTQEGFDVLTFDYRGYGRSTQEKPTRQGLMDDGCAVFQWVSEHPVLKNYEVYGLGQSLGGAVLLSAFASCPNQTVKGLVIDSSFSSYRKIAKLKLSQVWLTWPLQYPLSYLISDDLNPIDTLALIKVRMLYFHGSSDPVVPYELGRELYEATLAEKIWVDVEEDGHTRALAHPESPHRLELVKFLDQ